MNLLQKSSKRKFALISFCITVFGYLWFGAAFTAPYSAWWNSLNTGIFISAIALIFAIFSFPDFFAFATVAFSGFLLLSMLFFKFAGQ